MSRNVTRRRFTSLTAATAATAALAPAGTLLGQAAPSNAAEDPTVAKPMGVAAGATASKH